MSLHALLLPLALVLAAPAPSPTAATPAAPQAAKKPAKGRKASRASAAKVDCGPFECWLFDSPREAFRKVLENNPAILGVGEYHEIEGERRVKSSLAHFTASMLPELKGKAGDLVVETWLVSGTCGEVEKKATAEIEATTKRPQSTANELETMLLRAADLGIQPHILVVTCEEYEDLLTDEGELDAERLLQMVTACCAKRRSTTTAGPRRPTPTR
ncbi:MAG: hypothetical protein ACOX6T_12850 [Myxococcales bacterium]|jgi:hypothetical protein